MEHYSNVDIWQRKTTILREKSLPHWHFVHYRSDMDYASFESRNPISDPLSFVHFRSPLTTPGLNPGLHICPYCNFIDSKSHMDYPSIVSD